MKQGIHIRSGTCAVITACIAGCAVTDSKFDDIENRNVIKRIDSIDIVAEDEERQFVLFEFTPIDGEVSGSFSVIGARKGFRFGHMSSVSIGCTNETKDYWSLVRFRYSESSKLVADLERWQRGKIKNTKEEFAFIRHEQDVEFKVQWFGGENMLVSVDHSASGKISMPIEEPICFLGADSMEVNFRNVVLMQYL